MGRENEEINTDKNSVISILKKIQEPLVHTHQKEMKPIYLYKKIPFLTGVIRDASTASIGIIKIDSLICTLRQIDPSPIIKNGLKLGGVFIVGIDFLLIPVIYLSALILNEPVPFSLKNNIRWFYSALLFGFTLSALLVPAVAPFIGLASGGLVLGVSIFLLAKALRERVQLGRKRKETLMEIGQAENEMAKIQSEAELLEKAFKNTENLKQIDLIYQAASLLQKRYEDNKSRINALKDTKSELNRKIKKLDFVSIMDKGLGVSLGSLAVVGLATSLFFPPVGFAILTAVTLASLTYFFVRITSPLFLKATTWVLNKNSKATSEKEDSLEQKLEQQQELKLDTESVNTMLKHLPPTEVVKSKENFTAPMQKEGPLLACAYFDQNKYGKGKNPLNHNQNKTGPELDNDEKKLWKRS